MRRMRWSRRRVNRMRLTEWRRELITTLRFETSFLYITISVSIGLYIYMYIKGSRFWCSASMLSFCMTVCWLYRLHKLMIVPNFAFFFSWGFCRSFLIAKLFIFFRTKPCFDWNSSESPSTRHLIKNSDFQPICCCIVETVRQKQL